MNAIYKGKLYQVGDDLNQCRLLEDDIDEEGQCHGQVEITVDYGDPELIIDPTDDEINNILPDYVPDDGPDGFELPDGTPTPIGSVNLDQLIGCNVHGRLTYIRDLCKRMEIKVALDEINNLLAFFPKP